MMKELEREIVFGQVFNPKGASDEKLFVVTDTFPQHNPRVISAAEIVKKGDVERLGIPGGIDPSDVMEVQGVWDVERIIRAMGITYGSNLPERMQELLRENSQKPSRKT